MNKDAFKRYTRNIKASWPDHIAEIMRGADAVRPLDSELAKKLTRVAGDIGEVVEYVRFRSSGKEGA